MSTVIKLLYEVLFAFVVALSIYKTLKEIRVSLPMTMPRPRPSSSRGLTILFMKILLGLHRLKKKRSYSENLCSLKIVSYKHIGTCRQDNNPFSEKLSGQKKVGYKYIGKILARQTRRKNLSKYFDQYYQ